MTGKSLTSLELRPIFEHDLVQVAEIHISAFPGSVLSKFGVQTIEEYYHWQMIPPNICYAIGAFDKTDMLGFVFAGKFRNAELYFIQENIFFLFCQLLLHPGIIFSQHLFHRFGTTIAAVKEHFKDGRQRKIQSTPANKKRFGILSIAVRPRSQHGGIGKLLVEKVEQLARDQGFDVISLSVDPDNIGSVQFYEHTGWERVFDSPDNGWQGHLIKQISK